MNPVLAPVTPSSGSFASACMHAQARSPWLASSERLALYVTCSPLGVIVFLIAMNEAARSFQPVSNSSRPLRITFCAFITSAVLISTE